jgi:imidazole glycerol-phosphate synthase subunit HisH
VKVGIVNYGFGNIGSVRRALDELHVEPVVADAPAALVGCDRIILPGVGAFGEAMASLRAGGWVEPLRRQVRDAGVPLLGICLGMQLLAASSDEDGHHDGLGFVSGEVRRLDSFGCALRVPHVGWNEVRFAEGATLFAGIPQESDFYFVHSFALDSADPSVCATTSYGTTISAAVQDGRVFGTQFHPEKSSRAGRRVLRNFLDVPAC